MIDMSMGKDNREETWVDRPHQPGDGRQERRFAYFGVEGLSEVQKNPGAVAGKLHTRAADLLSAAMNARAKLSAFP